MNWSNVKSLAIPVGGTARDVKRVSIGGAVVWEKPSPLPYDSEVEYLESTGTQWINTGVKVYNDTNVEITVKVNTQSEVAFVGSATSTDRFAIRSYSGSLSYGFGSWWANTAATLYNQWCTLRTDVSVPTVYCDGTSYPTTNTPSAKSGTDSILIFDSFRANRGDVAVANVKIWRGSTLVFDGIPVRVGTTGYLYDRVSGQLFGNAGTGAFGYGQDVVPVEYIESHGTEWIDTGYIATEDTRVVATLYTNETGNKNWFGGSVASADLGYVVNSYSPTAIELRFGNSNWQKPSAQNVVGKVFTIDFGKSAVKINGDTIYTPSYTVFGVQTIPIAIFVRYGGTSYIKGRAYSFKIYEDSTSVRSFLPIRVSNEGAMMDTLTRRIYRNQGTGAFAYGADLPLGTLA